MRSTQQSRVTNQTNMQIFVCIRVFRWNYCANICQWVSIMHAAHSELSFHFCLQLTVNYYYEWAFLHFSWSTEHTILISNILKMNRNHNVSSLFVWWSCWNECILVHFSTFSNIKNMKFNHRAIRWIGVVFVTKWISTLKLTRLY